MTWKSYAVVSGATVLAGWLASSTPSIVPVRTATAQREGAPAASITAIDIEEQAARLQMRMRQEAVYHQPERNPFRFGARQQAARSAPSEPDAAPPPPTDTFVPPPPPPPVTLSGIAADRVGDRTERTAILSAPSGVLFVREGEDVLGQYRVARIEGDAVELTRLSDGTSVRLTLAP